MVFEVPQVVPPKLLAIYRNRHKQFLILISDEELDSIRLALVDGEPIAHISKRMYNEERHGISYNTFHVYLHAWRDVELHKTFMEKLQTLRTANRGNPYATLMPKINALQQIENLIAVQEERCALALDNERKVGKGKTLLRNTSLELNNLHTMLLNLAKLQLDAGVLPRAKERALIDAREPTPNQNSVYITDDQVCELLEGLDVQLEDIKNVTPVIE